MENIQKLYDIDAQLKYLQQEKHHRCLNMPYRVSNISCNNLLTGKTNMLNYHPQGCFPESNEVYVHNDLGYRESTNLYANSIENLFKYLFEKGVKSFDNVKFGIGENEKSLRPSDFYNTDDYDESFDDEELDKGEMLEIAFLCIIENYPILDDKLFSLIESLDVDNILMVEQILLGKLSEQ